MSNFLEKAIDEVDAAVFCGDSLNSATALDNFSSYLTRWNNVAIAQRKLLENSENAELKKALETCRQQISNYENTTKKLLEENRQLKSSINFNSNSPTLPKISDSTLEKLVNAYYNSKKSMITFDSWLYNCVTEGLKIYPKHPIDDDDLKYLQKCYIEHSKTARYTYTSLAAYLKESCCEFGKLEKIKAVL